MHRKEERKRDIAQVALRLINTFIHTCGPGRRAAAWLKQKERAGDKVGVVGSCGRHERLGI